MILLEELKSIVHNNTLANVDLTSSRELFDAIPGHDAKIVDTTKLILDMQRMANRMAQEIIGKNRIVVAGDNTNPSDIKRISTENMLRNDQRKKAKEMIYAR